MSESNYLPPRKRKHVSNACDECRRRRVRCNGDQPCSSCLNSPYTCTYAKSLANPDLRVNRVTAEQYHELSTNQTILHNLIASIRSGQADGVLDEIRAGASISDIGASLLRQQGAKEIVLRAREAAVPETPAGALTTPSTNDSDDISHASTVERRDWHPSLQARWDRNELIVGSEFEPIPSDSPYVASPLQPEYILQPVFSGPYSSRHSTLQPKPLGHRVRNPALGLRKQNAVSATGKHTQEGTSTTSFGNLPLSSTIVANHYPPLTQRRQHLNFTVPEHLLMPLLDMDSSPLGRLYVGFQQIGRKTILDTGQPHLVIGGLIPDAEDFFQSPLQITGLTTTYKWAYDINRSFEGIFSSATRLASSIIGGRLMRWLIHPTADTYASIPDIIRPTMAQRLIPHPGQLDLFLFPALRESMLTQTGDFVGAVIESGMDVSWPYTLNEAFIFDLRTGRLQLSPLFVAYATDTSNWKVGRRFVTKFPHLKHVVAHNLADEMVIEAVDRFW